MDDVVNDRYQPWSAAVLQGCADVLADTSTGLTGSKIGALLADLRIPDVNPSASKRDRLYAALTSRQNNAGHSQRVATFVSRVMDPALYIGAPHEFTMRQDRLNRTLTFAGLRVNDKGQIAVGLRRRRSARPHGTPPPCCRSWSDGEPSRTSWRTARSSCSSRTTSTPAWRPPRASSCGYASSPESQVTAPV